MRKKQRILRSYDPTHWQRKWSELLKGQCMHKLTLIIRQSMGRVTKMLTNDLHGSPHHMDADKVKTRLHTGGLIVRILPVPEIQGQEKEAGRNAKEEHIPWK